MLNWADLLFYIKGRLSLPSSFIEKTDTEIQKWVTLTALKDFSDHIPDKNWSHVDPQLPMHQTTRANEYLFFDDEDLPILGTVNFYFDETGMFATGHPIFPAMSFTQVQSWALETFKSSQLRPFSLWGYTGKYIQPNTIRILNAINAPFIVEYEREQPHDLRRIPSQHSRIFMELALAETMIWIGGMRSHYGDGRLTTPFGEIPLSGETLKSEGIELKRETIERLREISLPGVVIHMGI